MDRDLVCPNCGWDKALDVYNAFRPFQVHCPNCSQVWNPPVLYDPLTWEIEDLKGMRVAWRFNKNGSKFREMNKMLEAVDGFSMTINDYWDCWVYLATDSLSGCYDFEFFSIIRESYPDAPVYLMKTEKHILPLLAFMVSKNRVLVLAPVACYTRSGGCP